MTILLKQIALEEGQAIQKVVFPAAAFPDAASTMAWFEAMGIADMAPDNIDEMEGGFTAEVTPMDQFEEGTLGDEEVEGAMVTIGTLKAVDDVGGEGEPGGPPAPETMASYNARMLRSQKTMRRRLSPRKSGNTRRAYTLPLERCTKISGYVADQKQLKAAARARAGVFEMVTTSEVIDRDGDVVFTDGLKNLEEFNRNPLLLWMHDAMALPIGRTEGYRIDSPGKMHMATPVFTKRYDFALTVKGLMEDRALNAGSIRFEPHDIGDPIFENQMGVTIKSWSLLEYSIVTIPANQEALAAALKKYKSVGKHLQKFQLPGSVFSEWTRTGIVSVPKYTFSSLEEVGNFANSWCQGQLQKGPASGETDEGGEPSHSHEIVVVIDDDAMTIFGSTAETDNHAHPITEFGVTGPGGEDQHMHTFTLEAADMPSDPPEGPPGEEEPTEASLLAGIQKTIEDLQANAGMKPKAGSRHFKRFARTVNPRKATS